MDRKNRVWLIVLLVLFLAAVAGVIVVRQQLNDSRADYAAAHIQLTTEQENVAALQSELQAAEEEAQQLSADLEAQAAETESQQKAAEEAQARVAQLEADLETSEAKVAELEANLETSGTKVAELETGLSDAQAKIAELESQPTVEPPEPTAAPDATQTPQSTDGLETPSLQVFAGRMRKSSRSVRQARPCSVMICFFVRKMPMANSSSICACRLSIVENSGTDIPLSFECPLLMIFR